MIYFVGAGAGDPELLTIKAKKLIDSADVIIYAGSLVNPEIFRDVKSGCEIYDSSGMTLEEVLQIMQYAE
ncbi:MAG: cobalt-precorrin-4 C(11)-methyltransferase, partial [Oscillospiraceae bacterium]|nr:cobalt-precorrin-4 C(11)-methyltransferase [Oscillospiraceae bacterium]